jgi:hypothetical protein
MLIVALALSVIAAFYSIMGLAAIFAAAVVPIVIMGSVLEVAKLVVTVWLHEYWKHCRFLMKLYLVPAVGVLMLITSMGIFGFLSKAHSDQTLVSGDVAAQITLIDEKIRVSRETIDVNRKALKQLDDAVDQVMLRSNDERGAERSAQIRRNQARDRTRLLTDIETEQKKIAKLNEERAPIAAQIRKVEAEVGPIKYIAALIYDDNPDVNVLEKAVRWVIIMLVVVFDPLAIMMLLASTESFKWSKQQRGLRKSLPQPQAPKPVTDDHEFDIKKHPYLFKPWKHFTGGKPVVADNDQAAMNIVPPENIPNFIVRPWTKEEIDQLNDADDDSDDSPELKRAKTLWKERNPGDTLKNQRAKLARGEIDRLPWFDIMEEIAEANPQGKLLGFGIKFPAQAAKGDTFLRVDVMPSVLYKFNGSKWIVVDKTLSDQYAHDSSYIKHVIEKIASGELDPEMLTDAERDAVEQQLKKRS